MILTGDCVELMATLEAESVDAVVTDPPYGLEFMGKEWDRLANDWGTADQPDDSRGEGNRVSWQFAARDGRRTPRYHANANMQAWHETWAREAFRLLKPGGHLLAFGGTRTYHRLASAIEDAGFEIRDCLVWAYASGFPKSLDVSKAIDKAAGAEREVVDSYARKGRSSGIMGEETEIIRDVTAPATDAAKRWQGWGTALKPAWEPIVMARKPLRGTVAQNVTRYGTGALNIDATRIGTDEQMSYSSSSVQGAVAFSTGTTEQHPLGRWPANLILTDPLFDGGVPGVVGGGVATTGGNINGRPVTGYAKGWADERWFEGYGDTGTYSRFFLIPKAARSDREPVLRGQLPTVEQAAAWGDLGPVEGNPRKPDNGHISKRENGHPTVKPIELMRHLVRLVTPPGGTVLDCFLGSGTTAIACELEGFAWIGIEREPEYVAIAEARLNGTQRGLGLDVPAPTTKRSGKFNPNATADRYKYAGAGSWSKWSEEMQDEPEEETS